MSNEGTRPMHQTPGRMTRRGFLKAGGAGLAGAALLGVAGCGGGGGQRGGGGGGNSLVVALDQEPAILNQFIVGGDLVATNNIAIGIVESPLQIMPDLSPGLNKQHPRTLRGLERET